MAIQSCIQRLSVNEGNFKDIMMKKIHEVSVQFICSSETMHKLSKAGWMQNYCTGYTPDEGTCMVSTNGIMLMNKVAYTIYPYDIIPSIPGIESIITEVFNQKGVAIYRKPQNPQRTYILVYDG